MRAAQLIVMLLALGACAPSRAQGSFSNKDIESVLMQFIEDLSQSLSEGGAGKRKLLTVGEGLSAFMHGMFGANWTQHVPASWTDPSFNWASLGEFEYSSNLGDFLLAQDLANLTDIHSIQGLQAALAAVESAFCKEESFAPAAKVPAACTGPTVEIALRPKRCVLEPHTKQILCEPAKLVLTKTPGSCVHKHLSGSAWKGKECLIEKLAGMAKNATVGGAIKFLPLPDLHHPHTAAVLASTPAPAPAPT